MDKNIYEIGKCDYCDTNDVIIRPTPFMADGGAMMCKYCWNETEKEYANCNNEYISKFEDAPGYEEINNKLLKDINKDDDSIKQIDSFVIKYKDGTTREVNGFLEAMEFNMLLTETIRKSMD